MRRAVEREPAAGQFAAEGAPRRASSTSSGRRHDSSTSGCKRSRACPQGGRTRAAAEPIAPSLFAADAVQRLSLALQAETSSVSASTTKPPLVRVLHDRRTAALTRLFDLFALAYPSPSARGGGGDRGRVNAVRAGALELLDNVRRAPAAARDEFTRAGRVAAARDGAVPRRRSTACWRWTFRRCGARHERRAPMGCSGKSSTSWRGARNPNPAVRNAAAGSSAPESSPQLEFALAPAPVLA